MTDLASRIVAAMKRQGYELAAGDDVVNIVYIEGMDPDGTPNHNRANAFDDLRIVLRATSDGTAKILGMWDATTEPGKFWTEHRMNPAGAFHIALGPQTCWQMGSYHGMPALVQAAEIVGTRDAAEDYKREGPTVRGEFGVHHHGGYDYPHDDLGRSSAGCQVGRSMAGHREFMALIATDRRYKQNRGLVWTSTVLPAAWIAPMPAPTPGPPPIAKPGFNPCVALLLVHEGGNDDDPQDPGGRTSRGITQSEWDIWRRYHAGLPADVWRAPQDQVLAIYRANYWNAERCDDLAGGVDYCVFDYGVNSGVKRAAKVLQRFVGADQDGIIGPITIGKAARADPKKLVYAICDERLAFLQGLSGWARFGRGWAARVADVRRDALAMISQKEGALTS